MIWNRIKEKSSLGDCRPSVEKGLVSCRSLQEIYPNVMFRTHFLMDWPCDRKLTGWLSCGRDHMAPRRWFLASYGQVKSLSHILLIFPKSAEEPEHFYESRFKKQTAWSCYKKTQTQENCLVVQQGIDNPALCILRAWGYWHPRSAPQ